MDLLIQWVSQIIVFILVATIIDLLIPAGSMKKYIKFVVGLVLILLFLQPIFHLVNFDIEEAVSSSFSELFEDNPQAANLENLIELQKNEIESSSSAYILEQMAVQMKDIASAPLSDEYQTEIQDITFEFVDGTVYTDEELYEKLEEVIVYLRESQAGEGTVHAVEDVVIDTKGQVVNSDKEVDLEGMQSLLRDVWEITDKKITVIWEGGAS
ncbi:stage III sporulation protein AF [Ornithinibacillus contaminans]|uniref:stage III sporulation protein AF n=1 Tax=Ornithinibacillus contaminans TaxID=694055 RepID=UPI00064DC244|nr:stage III sporulation protein AF [Ornithinibacillus contaminans]